VIGLISLHCSRPSQHPPRSGKCLCPPTGVHISDGFSEGDLDGIVEGELEGVVEGASVA
jgi:hypothetical protein